MARRVFPVQECDSRVPLGMVSPWKSLGAARGFLQGRDPPLNSLIKGSLPFVEKSWYASTSTSTAVLR